MSQQKSKQGWGNAFLGSRDLKLKRVCPELFDACPEVAIVEYERCGNLSGNTFCERRGAYKKIRKWHTLIAIIILIAIALQVIYPKLIPTWGRFLVPVAHMALVGFMMYLLKKDSGQKFKWPYDWSKKDHLEIAEQVFVQPGRLIACWECDYDQRQSQSEACPECGASVLAEDHQKDLAQKRANGEIGV